MNLVLYPCFQYRLRRVLITVVLTSLISGQTLAGMISDPAVTYRTSVPPTFTMDSQHVVFVSTELPNSEVTRSYSIDLAVISDPTSITYDYSGFHGRSGVSYSGDVAGSLVRSHPQRLSADGRFVIRIASGDNGEDQAFLDDTLLGTSLQISDSTQSYRVSLHPGISGDGRFITYVSSPQSGDEALLLYDVVNQTTTQISDPAVTYTVSFVPSISADGQFIAYISTPQSGEDQVFVYNRLSGLSTQVSDPTVAYRVSIPPSISDDGRYVAYVATPQSGEDQVYVADVLTGVSAPVSDPTETYRVSFLPSISPDGLWVSYVSTGQFREDQIFLDANPLYEEPNLAPTADAGEDLSIRAGDIALLDGTDSFDDNDPAPNLQYMWSILSTPLGSSSTLQNSNTVAPSLVTDAVGTYMVELLVTDSQGLVSDPDTVLLSTENLPPTAAIISDTLVIVGDTVSIDGSSSTDPENDAVTYNWSLVVPTGSASELANTNGQLTIFAPDIVGDYTLSLAVSDLLGPGIDDTLVVTAISAPDYASLLLDQAVAFIDTLGGGRNLNRLSNRIQRAAAHLQAGRLIRATGQIQRTIGRVDGCALRGSADLSGSQRDWITNCSDQLVVYNLLVDALNAI